MTSLCFWKSIVFQKLETIISSQSKGQEMRAPNKPNPKAPRAKLMKLREIHTGLLATLIQHITYDNTHMNSLQKIVEAFGRLFASPKPCNYVSTPLDHVNIHDGSFLAEGNSPLPVGTSSCCHGGLLLLPSRDHCIVFWFINDPYRCILPPCLMQHRYRASLGKMVQYLAHSSAHF